MTSQDITSILFNQNNEQYGHLSTTEQQMRYCLTVLLASCDGARTSDNLGFSAFETSKKPFFSQLLQQTAPWSEKQIDHVARSLVLHRHQLEKNGIVVPLATAMQELKHKNTEARKPLLEKKKSSGGAWLDLIDEQLYLWSPFHLKESVLDPLKHKFYETRGLSAFHYGGKENGSCWITPSTSSLAFEMIVKAYPDIEMRPAALAVYQQYQAIKNEQEQAKTQQEDSRKKEYFQLLAQLNDLKGQFAPGLTAFNHQKIAVRWALWKKRVVIADEMGLGKTYEGALAAKAIYKQYNASVIVITKKRVMQDWRVAAEKLEMPISLYNWSTIPEPDPMMDEFVLVADESHNAQNLKANRTVAMMRLALHPKCLAVFFLTGSPLPNGRPIAMYPMLFCCKHPLVYTDNFDFYKGRDGKWRFRLIDAHGEALKKDYEKKFCAAHKKSIGGGKMIYDVTGSINLKQWFGYCMYNPDPQKKQQNFSGACIIRRLKKDQTDLPPKQRVMQTVEVSSEAARIFHDKVAEIFARYEHGVATKIAEYSREEKAKRAADILKRYDREATYEELLAIPDFGDLTEKEASIRRSEALVTYLAFRHAGAFAKIESTVEQALDIITGGDIGEDGRQHFENVVIFTTFKDVAAEVARGINNSIRAEYGDINYDIAQVLDGDTKPDRADHMISDFQNPNGKIKVIVGTASGGEGITLTRAAYSIIIDRQWRPEDVRQWEDRIHRIGQKNQVVIYWLQLPETLSPADVSIDALLQTKADNISQALQGKSAKIEFVDPEDFIKQNIMNIMRKSLKNGATQS